MPVTVDMPRGQLILDFQSIRFALDTGQEIEYGMIEQACAEYWSEWEKKAGSGPSA
jgi:hypothetical protein